MQPYSSTIYQKYYRSHREEKKEKTREYSRRIRNAVLEFLDKKCNKCGFDDVRCLQVDHINGGGTKEIANTTKHYQKMVLDSLIANEGKYQLLCANCNWIKRFENQEHR